jgi:dihydrofolate reductase
MLSLIVAAAENSAIGKNNDLMWHLPDDLKHFKRTTKGHHVISGRKTFESQGKKPLPGRTNIIITRRKNYEAKGCIVVSSLDEALDAVRDDDEPFITGGAEIYRIAMPKVDRIYLTRVHAELDADTFFSEPDFNQWRIVSEQFHPKDEKHQYSFTVYVMDIKK